MKTENQVPWSYKNVKVGRTAQNKSQAQIESKKLTKISLSIISWTQHLWAGIKKNKQQKHAYLAANFLDPRDRKRKKMLVFNSFGTKKALTHKETKSQFVFLFFYCECDQLCNSAYLLLLVNVLMQFGNEISDPKVSVTQGKSKKKYFYGFFSLP